jgi:hypothetical protein
MLLFLRPLPKVLAFKAVETGKKKESTYIFINIAAQKNIFKKQKL